MSPVRSLVMAAVMNVVCCATSAVWAQPAPPQVPMYDSVHVNPDRSVTLKLYAPDARTMQLSLEGAAAPLPMEKGADAVWSVTTPVLAPELYGYKFEVNGFPLLDPKNTTIKPNLLSLSNLMDVPAETPGPWEPRSIPHGEVHHEWYTTSVVTGLPQNQDDFYVYTPPNYDARAKKEYPVLYLLHGYSDDASGWTAVGKANLILDSLLAEGKIKPMIVVTPLGYGNMSFVRDGFNGWRDPATVQSNVDLYQKTLLTEVMPRVETEYRVSRKREDRAIAGLSMGGLEALQIGLTHTDQFAYVVGMSSAAASVDRGKLASLSPESAKLKLLWVACGTEDHLLDANREFIAFLKSKNLPVQAVETPGMHTWMVWRDNLIHVSPLLFQGR